MRARVAVVSGEGEWWMALLAAQAAGALAVVVGNPLKVTVKAAAALGGTVTVPVAAVRRYARPDAVAAAKLARGGNPPTLVTIECAAPRGQIEAALRDSLRWAAELGSGPLRVVSGAVGSEGGVALLEVAAASGAPIPVTLAVGILPDEAPHATLRVTALGEVRSHVESGGSGLATLVVTASASGSTAAPKQYEDASRLAFRRAQDAVSAGQGLADLNELLEDQRVVAELLGEHNQR